VKKSNHAGITFAVIDAAIQDIRYAVRALRKSGGFTVTAVIVLALAIGGNTAMFSVVDATMLRPLPYDSPEQLMMLWTESPAENLREGRSAYWNFEQWASQSRSFADMAAFDPASATLIGADKAERISVVRTTPNLLTLLRIPLTRGRMFSIEEAAQHQSLAVISHAFWQSHFAGSESAIGATINLDGVPAQVIGVRPPTLGLLQDADVLAPHTSLPEWETTRNARGIGAWFVIGRLGSGATIEQAQAEMNTIADRLDDQMPAMDRNRGISITPLALQLTGPRARLALWMLMGAVFCVLLVAATNITSLSLARGVQREKEIAIRTALGASRLRLARQLLAEGLTLCLLAGSLGLLFARVATRVLLTLQPAGLARLDEVRLNWTVVAWSLAVCMVTAIVITLAPAIAMLRRTNFSKPEGGRGISAAAATTRIRRVLIVAEFAIAIVLLFGAGLLIRSLWAVENVDVGFNAQRVLSLQLATAGSTPSARRADFYNRVIEGIKPLPGVESAAVIGDLFTNSNPERIVTIERDAALHSARLQIRVDEASDAFFKTVGTPLLRGRAFSNQDGADSPRVAIINDTMARRLWPGLDAVGQRFKLGAADSARPWVTVVGIVGDMRRQGLERQPIVRTAGAESIAPRNASRPNIGR
jgi:predicted permease